LSKQQAAATLLKIMQGSAEAASHDPKCMAAHTVVATALCGSRLLLATVTTAPLEKRMHAWRNERHTSSTGH
jgi:hypothetical protein